jgi:hypothetical protein
MKPVDSLAVAKSTIAGHGSFIGAPVGALIVGWFVAAGTPGVGVGFPLGVVPSAVLVVCFGS